jgi:hypothetical protein
MGRLGRKLFDQDCRGVVGGARGVPGECDDGVILRLLFGLFDDGLNCGGIAATSPDVWAEFPSVYRWALAGEGLDGLGRGGGHLTSMLAWPLKVVCPEAAYS